MPKIAANFGKKTAEKIATAVKSSGNTKLSKLNTPNGQDIYETDESGIDLAGSDISDSKTGLGNDERSTMTPLLTRRNPSLSVDLESSRSLQVKFLGVFNSIFQLFNLYIYIYKTKFVKLLRIK